MPDVAVMEGCPLCEAELSDEVLRSYLNNGGDDMATRNLGLGRLARSFLPPDTVPTLKTAAVGGVSLFVSEKVARRLVPAIKKVDDGAGGKVGVDFATLNPKEQAVWKAGIALVSGGLIWQLTKKRAIATAWAVAPAALAVFSVVDELLPDRGSTAGMRRLATVMPAGSPPPLDFAPSTGFPQFPLGGVSAPAGYGSSIGGYAA